MTSGARRNRRPNYVGRVGEAPLDDLTEVTAGRALRSFLKMAESDHAGQVTNLKLWQIAADFLEDAVAVRPLYWMIPKEKAVAVLGGAMLKPGSPGYNEGMRLGYLLTKAGFAVGGGAGPGLMDAAPKGAMVAYREDPTRYLAPFGLAADRLSSEQKTTQHIPEERLVMMRLLGFREESLLALAGQAVAARGGSGTKHEVLGLVIDQTRRLADAQMNILFQGDDDPPIWTEFQQLLERREIDGTIRYGERNATRRTKTVQETVDVLRHHRRYFDHVDQPAFDDTQNRFGMPIDKGFVEAEWRRFLLNFNKRREALLPGSPAYNVGQPYQAKWQGKRWIFMNCDTGQGQIAHMALQAFVDAISTPEIEHALIPFEPLQTNAEIDVVLIAANALESFQDDFVVR